MAFINKKERVYDIQLTQHGKALMSKGLFKPEFYAFYDDDIIYDSSYGGFSENQNDTEGRIKDSIRTDAQYNFKGLDEENLDVNRHAEVRRSVNDDNTGYSLELLYQPEIHLKDNFYPVASPLGTVISPESKLPSWEVNMISEEISGSVKYDVINGAMIPQIKIESTWETSYAQVTRGGSENLDINEVTIEGSQISKGDTTAYIKANKKHIIIELTENNSRIFRKDNFEVEVFKTLQPSEGDEQIASLLEIDIPPRIRKLRVDTTSRARKDLIINNILYDPQELQDEIPITNAGVGLEENDSDADEEFLLYEDIVRLELSATDSNYIDYFLDIQFDENIDNQILCRKLPRNNFVKDVLSDLQITCQDPVYNFNRPNIYRTEDYDDPCN